MLASVPDATASGNGSERRAGATRSCIGGTIDAPGNCASLFGPRRPRQRLDLGEDEVGGGVVRHMPGLRQDDEPGAGNIAGKAAGVDARRDDRVGVAAITTVGRRMSP
jgi:hypothetical protein